MTAHACRNCGAPMLPNYGRSVVCSFRCRSALGAKARHAQRDGVGVRIRRSTGGECPYCRRGTMPLVDGQRGTERAKVGEAAVVSGDGSAQERKSRRRSAPFRIDFVTGEHDTIGKVDGPNRRISLHRNNPSVAEVKARQNDEALLFFAASLLADYQSQKDKGQLPFSCRFASLVATILSRGTAAV